MYHQYMPKEVADYCETLHKDKTAKLIQQLVCAFYESKLYEIKRYWESNAETNESLEEAVEIGISWSSPIVLEVGFSFSFRAFNGLFGITLEDLCFRLQRDGGLWQIFEEGYVLEIIWVDVSDPAPPFDGDTDYVIALIPKEHSKKYKGCR